MRTRLFTAMAVAMLAGVVPVLADTHAPGAQTFDIACNGVTMTFVSPGFHAKAGQALGSTSVGVAFMITYAGEIVYQSPAFVGVQGQLTPCTSGDFTFWLLVPPLQ